MKRSLLLIAAGCFAAAMTAPAIAADVGVSVTIGQPGFYGHIDIGDFPQPAVIYRQPVVIHRVPGIVAEPLYLRVPPGHYKKWGKHCAEYNACGRPVYFVRDNWYNDVYVPRYREKYGQDRHDDQGGNEGGGRGNDEGRGRGHGHGHGHGRGD